MPTSKVLILSSDSCYPLGSPCFICWEPVKSQINFPVRLAATADYTAMVNHREVETSKLVYCTPAKQLFSVPTCTVLCCITLLPPVGVDFRFRMNKR